MSNRLIRTSANLVAKAARTATKANVNSACSFFLHQPKVPEAAMKLKKIK